MKAAGLVDRVEDQTTCCYEHARWEWYQVRRDSESFAAAPVEGRDTLRA